MIVYAFDCGPSKTGVAVLRHDHRPIAMAPLFKCLYGVHEPLDRDAIVALLDDARMTGGKIAIERVDGFAYEPSRVKYLIETARVEAQIETLALERGLLVAKIPAREWRAALCRKPNPEDEMIATVVRGIVSDLPQRTKAELAHVFDACGLGAYAIACWQGMLVGPKNARVLPLAKDIELAVFKARKKANRQTAARTAKKRAKKSAARAPMYAAPNGRVHA